MVTLISVAIRIASPYFAIIVAPIDYKSLIHLEINILARIELRHLTIDMLLNIKNNLNYKY